jgi:hypothetical protein
VKIMVFLHGTTIMHRSAIGLSRAERVQQVREGDESVSDFSSYIPVGRAPQKLRLWHDQGAEVVYLSSHRKLKDVEKDRSVLKTHQFPEGEVFFRNPHEGYADMAERVMPDLLIEDDCESIGGEVEMTYPHISPQKRTAMKSIVVKEFEGIDHLPDDLAGLAGYQA